MGAVRALLCLAVLLLVAAGTACTSLESGQAEAQAAQGSPGQESEPTARAKPPTKTLVYRNAHRICTIFNLKEMAAYYATPRRAQAVAHAHAMELYSTPRARREAVRGCLAALRER
jgi:hypothetical protein